MYKMEIVIKCQDKLYTLSCPTRLTILISKLNVNKDESHLLFVSTETRKRRREAVVSRGHLAGCTNPALKSYETTCPTQSLHQTELRLFGRSGSFVHLRYSASRTEYRL